MPDYQFMFTVRGISSQKAVAIGTRIEQALAAQDIDVSAVNTARMTENFRVLSVDTGTREVFDEMVEATDAQAASDQVETASRVVAMVHGDQG